MHALARVASLQMVDLQLHQPEWAAAFRVEAASIGEVLAAEIDAVEHIGSTAIPGLVAKPIIDLAARTTAAADPFALGPALSRIGYVEHRTGPRTHAVYVRSDGVLRTHILHVFTADEWKNCNQRVFRDKLLQDATARDRYQELKLSLRALTDGREYTAAKRSLIEELLNEERAMRGLPPTTAWDK